MSFALGGNYIKCEADTKTHILMEALHFDADTIRNVKQAQNSNKTGLWFCTEFCSNTDIHFCYQTKQVFGFTAVVLRRPYGHHSLPQNGN